MSQKGRQAGANPDGTFTPGYVNVPGKGQRYQNSSGQLFHNHFGPVLNQVGGFIPSLNNAYTNYYNTVSDAAGTERRDGSKAKGTNTGTGSRTADAPAKPPVQPQPRPSGSRNLPSDYKETEQEAGKKAEAHRPGAGLPQSGGGNQGTGRSSTRTSPTGVVQTGTDMGMANQLLQSLGVSSVKYGQFESNSLPTKADSETDSTKMDDSVSMSAKTTNQVNSEGVEGESELLEPTKETNIVNNGGALGSRERYRNEFMMDRGDATGDRSESMVGLRAAEASKGLLYASGKYWQEDGSGGFKEIDKATYKSIKRGDSHAQQFANERIDELTANLGTSSVDFTVTPEETPTQGTDIKYAVPDAADMPENGTLPLTDAQIPTQRLETLQKAAAKRKK